MACKLLVLLLRNFIIFHFGSFLLNFFSSLFIELYLIYHREIIDMLLSLSIMLEKLLKSMKLIKTKKRVKIVILKILRFVIIKF